MKVVMIVLFLAIMTSAAFAAGVPNLMTYQGKLTGTDGLPVVDGTYSLTLNIYSDSTGGVALWTETNSVNTEKGIFSTSLGSTTPLSPYLFSGSNLFLGISINGGDEMPARQRLTSVAYSFQAASADTAQYAREAPVVDDGDWVIGDTNIFRMHGNVGIGVTNPNSKLEIAGTTTIKSIQNGIASQLAFDSKNLLETDVNTGQIFGICNEGASDSRLGFNIINTNGTGWLEALTIKNGGRVGFNNSDPQYILDVNGEGRVHNYLMITGHPSDPYFAYLSSAYNYQESFSLNVRGGDPQETKIISFGNVTTSLGGYGAPRALNIAPFTGNVGIGTTAPVAKLHVIGDLCVTGQKNAIVPTSKGMTKVYSEESAEVWFTDYGRAKLASGQCHIDLDPLFLETVTIDHKNLMMVFLQEEGECNGLIVKPGTSGFDVLEKGGGKSDAQFSYRIVAKRKGQETERLANAGGGK
jgi:hypothetical protein